MRLKDGSKQKGGSFEPPFCASSSGRETRPQGMTLNFGEEMVPTPPSRTLASEFATMLTIAFISAAETESGPEAIGARPARTPGLLPLFALGTVLIYAQAVLGGMVSSSQAALVCPDWPTCRGEWFPALTGPVGLHMAHRYGAYALTLVLGVIVFRARSAADPVIARAGQLLLALVVGQMALGVLNIVLGIQPWISALHLANATGMLALSVTRRRRVLHG